MGEESRARKWILKAKPFLAMVALQFGFSGMYIVIMVSFKHGMSHYVLAVYRHVVATLIMAPFALTLERKIRPKMTIPIFLRIMVLGFLVPVLDQNLYYVGMKYTSAAFAAAAANVLPAITFILAIIFKLEKVNIKRVRDIAKIMGTTVTVAGAMVMTLYKGPILEFLTPHATGIHLGTPSATTQPADQHWVLGTLMLLASCCFWAAFFILQSFTLMQYPAELSLTALICLTGTVEGAAVQLVLERDMSAWKIGFDSRLLAVAYTGVFCSGIAYYGQGMVIKERGPVFVTAFSPLCTIITAALGIIFLAEQLHLGSVIGAVLIVIGLYTVLWGKSKDKRESATALTNEKELPITTTDATNFDSGSNVNNTKTTCNSNVTFK